MENELKLSYKKETNYKKLCNWIWNWTTKMKNELQKFCNWIWKWTTEQKCKSLILAHQINWII